MSKDVRFNWSAFLGICLLVIFLATSPGLAQKTQGGIFQMVGDITIEENQVIDGDVNTMAGKITVHGTVHGDVTSVAGRITIYGKVNGDVQTTGGNIYLKDTAEISGDVTVLGGKIYRADGAQVQGSVTQMVAKGSGTGTADQYIHVPNNIQFSPYLPWYLLIWGAVTGLVSWLALGAFLMLFFAKPISRLAKEVEQRPGYYFIIGLVSYLLFPPLLVLMFITIVGIPLAIMLVLLVLVGTLFGQLAVARNLGEQVTRRFKWNFDTEMAQVLIGLITIFVITLIPVIGWVFFFATACIGFGVVLVKRFGIEKKQKKQQLGDQTGQSDHLDAEPYGLLDESMTDLVEEEPETELVEGEDDIPKLEKKQEFEDITVDEKENDEHDENKNDA